MPVGSADKHVLATAVGAAAAVVAAAPFVGQVRGAIQAALPGSYRALIEVTVAVALVVAVAAALRRIRTQRTARYGALAAALVVGTLYAAVTATGNPAVDAVERFHFVEYGLLTFLFHRAWRHRGDITALLLPALACLLTGTFDEWLQWLVPGRVGELRDIVLNLAAIACGLLFSMAVHPPARLPLRVGPDGRAALAGLATAVIVATAAFVHVVHFGYEIRDSRVGVFRSRFAADTLAAASADRMTRWREAPPAVLRPLSREDQYLAEGLWHLQRRNEQSAANNGWAAWRENIILENYYEPILAFPSYGAPTGGRWSPEQRAAAARAGQAPGWYVSDAQVVPILTWNRGAFWTAVLAVVLVVVWALRPRMRASGSKSSIAPSTT